MFTLKTVAHDGSFNFQSIEGLHFQPATGVITYQPAGSPVGRADNGYLYASLFNSDGKHIETVQGPSQTVPDTADEVLRPISEEEDTGEAEAGEDTGEADNVVGIAPVVPPMAPGVAGDVVTSTPR